MRKLLLAAIALAMVAFSVSTASPPAFAQALLVDECNGDTRTHKCIRMFWEGNRLVARVTIARQAEGQFVQYIRQNRASWFRSGRSSSSLRAEVLRNRDAIENRVLSYLRDSQRARSDRKPVQRQRSAGRKPSYLP